MGGNSSKSTASQPEVPRNWNATHIRSQKNKIVIVTGGNSGIGFITALELARNGAHVVLACRNRERGLKAEADIRELIRYAPDHGTVKLVLVDIGDLSSVHAFCELFKKMHPRVDLLINNAGIVGGTYTKTVDGHELQFATNYLGHFALTAQLFDQLKKSECARVITVSSEYGQIATYCVSKLCNLLFTLEFDRRLKAAGINTIIAAAAHPGYCDTNIMKKGAQTNDNNWWWWLVFRTVAAVPPQSAEKGALPILYAATAENVKGGDYYGPKYMECYGSPIREDPSSLSKSESAASKLWDLSEKLTRLKFEVTK
ncbi:putative short-chain dehydrogenase/reductase SDR, NAD(P)-binding domain superfamily [Plasmopara halstedii]